jgi:hypothetical protein
MASSHVLRGFSLVLGATLIATIAPTASAQVAGKTAFSRPERVVSTPLGKASMDRVARPERAIPTIDRSAQRAFVATLARPETVRPPAVAHPEAARPVAPRGDGKPSGAGAGAGAGSGRATVFAKVPSATSCRPGDKGCIDASAGGLLGKPAAAAAKNDAKGAIDAALQAASALRGGGVKS